MNNRLPQMTPEERRVFLEFARRCKLASEEKAGSHQGNVEELQILLEAYSGNLPPLPKLRADFYSDPSTLIEMERLMNEILGNN